MRASLKPKSAKNKDGESTQDPAAEWNVKAGSDGKIKSTYGFKAHLNVDEDGFIKANEFTAGNVHDSNLFTQLLEGDESSAYADSAYASRKHEEYLEAHGIDNRIIKRSYRNTPLTYDDKRHNQLHSGVRSIVERVIGVLKLHYDMAKAHYLGLERNRTRFDIMCFAHNIKRGVTIKRECCALMMEINEIYRHKSPNYGFLANILSLRPQKLNETLFVGSSC